jgi:hypothetical protein
VFVIAPRTDTKVRDDRIADEDIESAREFGLDFSSLPGQETADGTVAGAYSVIPESSATASDRFLLSHSDHPRRHRRPGGYEPSGWPKVPRSYVSCVGIEAISGPVRSPSGSRNVIDNGAARP